MTTRRVKTDEERARDELAIYEKRVRASAARLREAEERYEAEKDAHERLVAVRDHLAAHPALRSDEPVELLAEPVAADGPGSDEPQAATG